MSSVRSNTVAQTTESLPFRVEIASRQHLQEVAQLRVASYGKHLPALAATLSQPEPADFARGCEVFVAKSKFDGSLLGTLRTHTNAFNPLPLEASVELPTRFRGTRMLETTRLCVKGSSGASTVRSALFKAMHLYCLEQKVDWMLAAARPPIDRIHDSLLFADVFKRGVYYPMAHAGGVPHRVLFLSPTDAQRQWGISQHPLYHFAFETHHPDIDISMAQDLNFSWKSPDRKTNVSYLPERRNVPRPSTHDQASHTIPMALKA
jgi:hypothetical protein